MSDSFVESIALPDLSLWERIKNQRKLLSFDLELTARCNNNCRHCYINLPVNDTGAKNKELKFDQIKAIVDQAVELGALWCLITGGEPLLREDFFDIYLYLKKKGILVSIFTNANLITDKHIELFKKYPPRDIEVTVYGVTQKTYEAVTRKAGSYAAFLNGLNLLLKNRIKVRYKAMAIRSNFQELPLIARFCREHTTDYFRFDPFLHLRFDADQNRNKEIKSERLTPEEIVAIEQQDSERSVALKNNCDKLIVPEFAQDNCRHLFRCGTGNGSFSLSYDGLFRLCSSLWQADCVCDLKKIPLKQAWEEFALKVKSMYSEKKEFLEKCCKCPIINLCIWCPAHAYLETQELDKPVDYFCEVAHARQKWLEKKLDKK
ncbi:MAG: radical SAM protein [Candidatus Omnitrophica bacterium]|nr:radical SAM protein [Candidatus Omnitrophota bacterium]